MDAWSDEIRVAFAPRRAYAELAERSDGARRALERIVRLLLVIGVFVAIGTAGRLAPFHVAATLVFWAFVPALQSAAVAIAIVAAGRRGPLGRALSLYFAGHAPWMLLLLALAGLCILSPDPGAIAFSRTGRAVVLVAVLTTLVWGVITTAATFVVGLGLGAKRGALATVAFYLAYLLLLAIWYAGLGQVQTLIWAVS